MGNLVSISICNLSWDITSKPFYLLLSLASGVVFCLFIMLLTIDRKAKASKLEMDYLVCVFLCLIEIKSERKSERL